MRKMILSYRFIMALVAFLLSTISGMSQSLGDDWFERMRARAMESLNNESSLVLADSIETISVSRQELHKIPDAHLIRARHYFRTGDAKAFDKATGDCINSADKYGRMDIRIYVMNLRITFLLNIGEYASATREAEEFMAWARNIDNPQFLLTANMAMGSTNAARYNYSGAEHYFREALRIREENSVPVDVSNIYRSLARLYLCQERYSEARNLYMQAYDGASAPYARSIVLTYLCLVDMMTGDKTSYDSHLSLLDESGVASLSSLNVRILNAAKAVNAGDYARAMELVHEADPYDFGLIEARLAEMGGDEKMASYRVSRSSHIRDSIIRLYSIQAMDDYGREIGLRRISAENEMLTRQMNELALRRARLELENASLEHNAANLELVRIQDSVRLQRSMLERDELEYSSNRRREDIASSHRIEMEREKSERMTRMFILIIIALLLTMMAMAVYFRLKRRQIRRINEALVLAEASDKEKMVFVQNISHEIRTPLNAIMGFSSLLARSDDLLDEDEKLEVIGVVRQNTDVLNRLVGNLLLLSWLQTGRDVVRKRNVSVNQLCIGILKKSIANCPKGVDMRYETTLGNSFETLTDARLVQEVLDNYMDNAIKHTRKGEIVLSATNRNRDGYVTFTVTDTGEGIPKDRISNIFSEFEKADSFKQGAGLGLSICQMIARKLSGIVEVDKDRTSGARFLFHIPVESRF